MRIQINKTCYQCRYGDSASTDRVGWCSEASRRLGDLDVIPDWCPLPVAIKIPDGCCKQEDLVGEPAPGACCEDKPVEELI